MKKVLMVLSLFVLFSCENESEQSDFDYDIHNDKVLSVAEINNVSEEVVEFHDYFINYFWNDVYEANMTCDSNLILVIRNAVIDKAKTYSFIYIDKTEFDECCDSNLFVSLCFNAMNYDTLNLSYIQSLYGNSLDMNYAMVEREANNAVSYLENLFYNSSTPEEMIAEYEKYVNQKLLRMKTTSDYICLKLYTDMYLGSFTTWCNILYGGEDGVEVKKKAGWLSSAWQKAKKVAKQVWKEAKPVVSADAQGAAEGVATALATGPTGAGAAAVTGACVSSAGKCIERIINTKEN